jgi:hypothetical protein
LEVQYKSHRDKFIESYQGKEHLVHATPEDPHGIDFVASNMMKKYQKLLNKLRTTKLIGQVVNEIDKY